MRKIIFLTPIIFLRLQTKSIIILKMKAVKKGFTLIELLVVISIIGVLLGIVGPKVFDLLLSSGKTKIAASFSAWASQVVQYKAHYGYYPPFLFEEEEGTPIIIEDDDLMSAFLISLKGKGKNSSSGLWETLTEEQLIHNQESREFHSFNENEFNDEGDIIGFGNLQMLVDQDGDGAIQLSDDVVDDILSSLSLDYSSDQIDNIDRDIFSVVNQPIIIFLLSDEKEDVTNVFSWNIEKYFK